MVGTGRFELPTPRTPSECSTRLSHVPTTAEVCFPSLSPARSPAWPQMEANFQSRGQAAGAGSVAAVSGSVLGRVLRLTRFSCAGGKQRKSRKLRAPAATELRRLAKAPQDPTAGNNCAAGSLSERCGMVTGRMFSGAEQGRRPVAAHLSSEVHLS